MYLTTRSKLVTFILLLITSPMALAQSRDLAMITPEFAKEFAEEWIEAWNAHDLPRILSHYRDDFSMSSPLIRSLMNEPSGTLQGKEAIAAYWSLALSRQPQLHFTVENILVGANSITLYYQGSRGLSAEVFIFDEKGAVASSFAHYSLAE